MEYLNNYNRKMAKTLSQQHIKNLPKDSRKKYDLDWLIAKCEELDIYYTKEYPEEDDRKLIRCLEERSAYFEKSIQVEEERLNRAFTI
jgi:ribosomal protein S15P/S13E